MIVQPIGQRLEITPGEQRLDPLQERGIDRKRVGEDPVGRAGLLHDDLAVPHEDLRLDLGDVLVDEHARIRST